MPDPNIRTNTDLTRAQAYEAELKREIAKAKDFGTNYTAYETRLKGVRADIEKYRAAHAALEKKRLAATKKSPAETLADLISTLASGPLGIIQSGLSAAQNAAAYLSKLTQAKAQKDAARAANEKHPGELITNSVNPSATPAQPANQSSSNAAPTNTIPAIPPQPIGPTNSAARGATNPPSSAFQIQTPGENPGNSQPTSAAPTSALGGFATDDSQNQALQSVGARLQTALQQNALITNSLFQQTLELIDSQNRKLGDVDRKISELTNQMKSLKNP